MRFSFLSLILLLNAAFSLACSKDDDGGTPSVSLDVANVTQKEGNSDNTATLVFRLSAAAEKEIKVHFQTSDGSAKAGSDYVAQSGDVTFAVGEKEKSVTFTVKGDSEEEPEEYFAVNLSNPVNVVLGKNIVSIVLTNDDLFIPTEGYTTPTSYPGRSLVWSDEFNGTTLDLSAWQHEIGNGQGGWGNNELQYYRPENTTVSGGYLVIEARRETFSGYAYTSSRIISKGKKEFKYGRIDMRAALPEGQGIWPALWMLGGDIGTVGWPACGEIDIMELVGHQAGTVHGTAHYGASVAQHGYKGSNITLPNGEKFAQKFHVFSLEWVENSMKWYVDDQLFYTFTSADTGGQPYPFNDNFFFIFNLAVGGNWPGNPDGTTQFPQQMIVDYVRVFQ